MAGKVVVYQESSRKVLEAGMDVLAVAVSITLGPRGRNVVLGKKFLAPQIVNDGVIYDLKITFYNKIIFYHIR